MDDKDEYIKYLQSRLSCWNVAFNDFEEWQVVNNAKPRPTMGIKELELADFSLVEINAGTPHCKKHGAMNKITKNEDGGGIWRCIHVVSTTTIKNGNSIGKKENDNVCRAGCVQIGLNQPETPNS